MHEQSQASNPEQGRPPKLQARRDLEFQEQIRAHGGDGRPLNLKTAMEKIAACERGQCLNCGGYWDALFTHVWKHYPPLEMTEGIKAYYTEHELSPDVRLTTQRYRERCKQGQLARMHGPEGEQIRANLSEKASRPQPQRRKFKSWPVVRLISQGIIADKVAEGLELDLEEKNRASAVNKRARSLGLREWGAECVFDYGKPFDNSRLVGLRRIAGFSTSDEFDRCAGLPEGRSNGTRPTDTLASPEHALLAMEWRDGVLTNLFAAAKKGVRVLQLGDKHFPQDQILKTFLPELGELNDALGRTMDAIRQEARSHPDWTVDDLCEEVCTRAEIEQGSKSADTRWRVTLRYLWQAVEWLKGENEAHELNMDRLRASELPSSGQLAREMVGSRYGASHWTVQNAPKPSTTLIEPAYVRALIKEFAPTFAQPPKKAAHRPKGAKGGDTGRRITIAAALTYVNRYSQPAMVAHLYPGQHDQEAGRKAVNKFLSRNAKAIEREMAKMTPERAEEVIKAGL